MSKVEQALDRTVLPPADPPASRCFSTACARRRLGLLKTVF